LEFRGEGGFMDWNFKSIGVMQFGIPIVSGGGGFSSEFPKGEDGKSFARNN